MPKPWTHTHTIIRGTDRIRVCLVADRSGAGQAYTEEEWATGAKAGYARLANRSWVYLGRKFDGRAVGHRPVRGSSTRIRVSYRVDQVTDARINLLAKQSKISPGELLDRTFAKRR